MTALEDLKAIIDVGTPPPLTDTDLQHALGQSLTPDNAGRWPGSDGYQPTYDLSWAAAELYDLRAIRAAAQPVEEVTRVTSEGTTFEVKTNRVDWAALARRWRAKSQIGQAIGYGTSLGVAHVGEPPAADPPTSQAARWT